MIGITFIMVLLISMVGQYTNERHYQIERKNNPRPRKQKVLRDPETKKKLGPRVKRNQEPPGASIVPGLKCITILILMKLLSMWLHFQENGCIGRSRIDWTIIIQKPSGQ